MVEAGLSSHDFWILSPRDFFWISRQLEERELRLHSKFALLCSVIANGLLKHPDKRPFSIEDFMPRKPARKSKSPDELVTMARFITKLLGGEVRG
ncbi:MAG: hypothetical protein QXW98_04830 [Candidatus Caldarchaeum sp.]